MDFFLCLYPDNRYRKYETMFNKNFIVMKKLALLSTVFISLLLLVTNCQAKITISGIVTDASSGQPLPGVNVLEKGTSNSVVSDVNGTYTINLNSENAVLQFSYVGFETEEVKLKGRTTINVQLNPVLVEVVTDMEIAVPMEKKTEMAQYY